MKDTILKVDGVRSVDLINTRLFGNRIYVDLEISINCSISVEEGHRIAENVHLTLEREYPDVKHVMVHVNPYHPSDCSDRTSE
jgi:divalent metal cation (Fe/Co/Zn/Cd) transporter